MRIQFKKSKVPQGLDHLEGVLLVLQVISSSRRGVTATLASRIVRSQTSGKPILRLPGVKVKLNANFNFKVSRTALLSNKFLSVGRRLLTFTGQ
jgi:hypothetical protein